MYKLTAMAAAGLIGIFGVTASLEAAKPPQIKNNFSAAEPSAPKKKKAISVTADKKKKKANKVTVTETRKKTVVAIMAATPKRTAAQSRRSDCDGFFHCLFGDSQRAPRGPSAYSSGDQETRQTVDWDDPKYKPGSIIVRTPERALYYVLPGGQAYRYKVGVGREGFQWGGVSRIVNKQEWPQWRPPEEMKRREAEKGHILPDVMEGGPENPLGARAMYIGGTLFRIHGTNNAASIGGAVSSGCIRMMNSDVIDLYDRVKVGSRVYVYQ